MPMIDKVNKPHSSRRHLEAVFERNATAEDKAKETEILGLYGASGSQPNPERLFANLWVLRNTVWQRSSRRRSS